MPDNVCDFGFVYYGDVVHGAGSGCLRFNTTAMSGAKIYNNTFAKYSSKSGSGVVNNDWNLGSNALDMESNIIYATSGGSQAAPSGEAARGGASQPGDRSPQAIRAPVRRPHGRARPRPIPLRRSNTSAFGDM